MWNKLNNRSFSTTLLYIISYLLLPQSVCESERVFVFLQWKYQTAVMIYLSNDPLWSLKCNKIKKCMIMTIVIDELRDIFSDRICHSHNFFFNFVLFEQSTGFCDDRWKIIWLRLEFPSITKIVKISLGEHN